MKIVVSPQDVDLLEAHQWSVGTAGYAQRSMTIGSRTDGSRRTKVVLLHRLIAERMGALSPDAPLVDHINRDKLDNRRENLRGVDAKGNAANRPAHPGPTPIYTPEMQCAVAGCSDQPKKKSMCQRHYLQAWKRARRKAVVR